MKTKILKFSLLTAALGIGLWSCKKGMEPIINSNEIQASKINTNQFSHNYRIKNIFNAFLNESIINKEKFISIINLEFEDELNHLEEHTYYSIISDPFKMQEITNLLTDKLIYNTDILNPGEYSELTKSFYNEVISKIPNSLKVKIPVIWNDIKTGEITSNNYISKLNSEKNELLSNNQYNSNETMIIDSYFQIIKESYILWHPTNLGGEGYYSTYNQIIDNKVNFFNQTERDDNDWPSGAVTPDYLNDDVIGGVAVSAVSGGWWGIIVGAVSASLMSAN